ncbi:unnamed protein product [Closterium sp. Naga37s-1]|nr:unnamed protein product [Closterium sp. Naga37s-1]
MAFIRARCVLLFAFLAAALVTVAYAQKSVTIYAKLNDYKEVPSDDTEAARNAVGDRTGGNGDMAMRIYKRRGQPVWTEYSVMPENMDEDTPPTMTQIHKAPEGSNGPVVLDLPCTYQQMGSRDWLCNGSLGKEAAERTGELASALKELLENPSGFYLNLHTEKYPDGAMRGQFFKS